MAASTITVHSFSRKTRKTKPKKAPNMVQVQISFFIQQLSGISHAACEVFYFQLHETLFNLSFFDKITNLWSSMQLKLQGKFQTYKWSFLYAKIMLRFQCNNHVSLLNRPHGVFFVVRVHQFSCMRGHLQI